jgi:hypothetical protein
MGTELDTLVVGNAVMHRHEQNPTLRADYKNAFELD